MQDDTPWQVRFKSLAKRLGARIEYKATLTRVRGMDPRKMYGGRGSVERAVRAMSKAERRAHLQEHGWERLLAGDTEYWRSPFHWHKDIPTFTLALAIRECLSWDRFGQERPPPVPLKRRPWGAHQWHVEKVKGCEYCRTPRRRHE